MTMANRVREFLDSAGIAYDAVTHPRTATSTESAQAAHISGELVAKTVVIHHGQGYMLAVVPSTHRVELGTLQGLVDIPLGLATEDEVGTLFEDCDLGAVPPLGAAYGLNVIVDESLIDAPEVYFEGGDHKTLVRVAGDAFRAMMKDARQGRFSHHV
ncbi:MAG: aminoacyl-tRNA deacylase [Alphaproteobacteria bacterium]|nr:aminoacyl-tRNA deacylase [Alphaproteobacteria bacterium]